MKVIRHGVWMTYHECCRLGRGIKRIAGKHWEELQEACRKI